MGGQIDVDSEENKGSTFWFTIQSTIAAAKKHNIGDVLKPNLRNIRILCVDDDAINRHILKEQAESLGMRCDVVENGFDAIAKLRAGVSVNDPYKICLIDYTMPMINGIHLVKEIRKNPEIAKIPMIMMTTMGTPIPEQDLKRLSLPHVLTKPMRQSAFYEAVFSILHKNGNHEIDVPVAAIQNQDIRKKPLPIQSKSARILLAEDNEVNQKVALYTLESLGYKADVVSSGIEALEAIKKSSYDLIIMDCQMPEMDGYAATREIRRLEHKNHTEHKIVIAMTANAVMGDKEECLAAGMDDYISKPLDITEVERILEHWLGSSRNN